MDPQKKQLSSNSWAKASCSNELLDFSNYISQQQQTENSSFLDYDDLIRKQTDTDQSSLTDQMNFLTQDLQMNNKSKTQLWDPKVMLNNLSVMEEKIHQLQELVRLIVARSTKSSNGQPNELLTQQQQLVTADLTSIIIQLISTAGSLLPSVKNPQFSLNPSMGTGFDIPAPVHDNNNNNNNNDNNRINNNNMVNKVEDHSNDTDHMDIHEEHESKDEDDVDEGENLPPGSYEILQLEKEEILAPHTHFCLICGKGFKRDANLRMHMRGHGDEYKTPAALAKPHKDIGSEPKLIKRYSCPFIGCKRNKDHKKFQPLKTILCVKNHYKRSHCDKSYTCSRCNTKKFSVIADLKTHEKHCGRDRWLCSCGTTFSRKDKLFGHISLFQGHTPALPVDEPKGGPDGPDNNNSNNNNVNNTEAGKEGGFFDFSFGSNGSGGPGVQFGGDPNACFSPLNGFQEFPRGLFEDSESFSFVLQGSGNYAWRNGAESSSKDVQ